VAEGWRCECLKDLGSEKLNVSYSTVSGGSWEVSVPAKVGSMGDAAWRKSTANYGVPAKVGPSSAHRRLTWNAEAAVAARRPPGSGRGSVGGARLIMKKRVAARDVLAFCPPQTALRLETSCAFAALGFHTLRRGEKVPSFVVFLAASGRIIF